MNGYLALALSYRRWYYRMSPVGWEHLGAGPAVGFAAIGATNIFSLILLVGLKGIPAWVAVLIPAFCGVIVYWRINSAYRSNPIDPIRAELSDSVPTYREFPGVYAYLFATMALFVTCSYVAFQAA